MGTNSYMIIVGSIVDIDEAKEIKEIVKISMLGKRIRSLIHEIVV
jgi:hypothetical protein